MHMRNANAHAREHVTCGCANRARRGPHVGHIDAGERLCESDGRGRALMRIRTCGRSLCAASVGYTRCALKSCDPHATKEWCDPMVRAGHTPAACRGAHDAPPSDAPCWRGQRRLRAQEWEREGEGEGEGEGDA
eukprot:2310535-Prymnesium_polylepis.1